MKTIYLLPDEAKRNHQRRPVLQNACKAYEESGGSMKALLTSLLTSDAFLYRKVERGAK